MRYLNQNFCFVLRLALITPLLIISTSLFSQKNLHGIDNYDTVIINRKIDTLNLIVFSDNSDSVRKRCDFLFNELQKVLKISSELNFHRGIGIAHFFYGVYYLNHEYNAQLSIAHFKDAIPFLKDSNSLQELKMTYTSLGNLFQRQGRLNEAKKYVFQVIKLSETINDNGKSQATAEGFLAFLFYKEKKYQDARYYYKKSLDYYKKAKLSSHMIPRIIYLGIIQLEGFNNPDSAIQYFNRAQNLADSINESKYFEGGIKTNIGHAYLKMGRNELALQFLMSGRQHLLDHQLNSNNTVSILVQNTFHMAQVYISKNQFQKAELLLLDAVDLIKKHDEIVSDIKLRIYDLLSELNKRKGNFVQALYWRDIYVAEFVKISEQQQKQVEDLEAYYDAEQNAAENIILRSESVIKDKTIMFQKLLLISGIILVTFVIFIAIVFNRSRRQIKLKNEALKNSNQKLNDLVSIRERLLSVMAHDIRGPLNNIQSLTALKKFVSADEMVSLEAKIATSVSSTLGLLNNILKWSSSQLTETSNVELSNTRLFDIIEDVHKTYKPLAEQKGLQLLIDPFTNINVVIETDPAIIHLVIRNLVNNAIKFTKSGSITICYRAETDQVRFEVIDTGVGIPKAMADAMLNGQIIGNKSLGTSKEKGSGLGLALCQTFLAKLNSRLYYKENIDGGSVFFFNLCISTDYASKSQVPFLINSN